MAVTFTNKAAQEMRERVERLLETRLPRDVGVDVPRRLCARLLRREAHNIGLSRDFTIYDSADQQAVIKQLLKDYHLDAESLSAAHGAEPHQPREEPHGGPGHASPTPGIAKRSSEIGKLFEGYIKALKNAQRARFRRSAAGDRRAVRSEPGRPRALRATSSTT